MDITELLALSAKQGASDLHLSAGLPPVMRVNGELERLPGPPLGDGQVRLLLESLMDEELREQYSRTHEADFSHQIPGLSRYRVNAFVQQRGAAAVLRTIPDRIPTLSELGMGEIFERLVALPRGLVLVTGPTGSGKSTTLAAMIDHINRHRRDHILTIEDPIEFIHHSQQALVSQREVHRHTEGFAVALRSALREDPDVILVGEIRDLETARLAMTAAETGHLVFATLHTASAVKTIDRIIDAFPGDEKNAVRTMLSESLQAVVSQALLPSSRGGRVAAREILLINQAIRHLIREDKLAQIYSSMQTGGQAGMQTLDADLARLVACGEVAPEDARRLTRESLVDSGPSAGWSGGQNEGWVSPQGEGWG
ncbi:type IV pilus twitching motility protein PilT [Halomonas sp. DP1Y21-3]|uniref:type IV pilus twitching motility protein PilT n=1 Tax=Halomonas sp. DP1Y21-3 TaxID=2859080 RepID=UPI001C9876F9|nr:type IV pilus twitching motility protein PilT [Halomonas sp. DP1Y21-3]MBY6111133.1 type IV pilus twitching motility protein PilT [Halomonas sp. DP1Y21-3]